VEEIVMSPISHDQNMFDLTVGWVSSVATIRIWQAALAGQYGYSLLKLAPT
jgi:hypothetical protein